MVAIETLRKQKACHAFRFDPAMFNPAKPYNSVLLAAITGSESIQFWHRKVKDKARQWFDDQPPGSVVRCHCTTTRTRRASRVPSSCSTDTQPTKYWTTCSAARNCSMP